MGEMADYYADLAMQQQGEFDEEVADVLKKTKNFCFLTQMMRKMIWFVELENTILNTGNYLKNKNSVWQDGLLKTEVSNFYYC